MFLKFKISNYINLYGGSYVWAILFFTAFKLPGFLLAPEVHDEEGSRNEPPLQASSPCPALPRVLRPPQGDTCSGPLPRTPALPSVHPDSSVCSSIMSSLNLPLDLYLRSSLG